MLIKYTLFLISYFFTFSLSAQWQQLNDVPFETDHSNGFGFNGKGYVIKGTPNNNAGVLQNEIWEYDPQLDSWERLGFANIPARDIAIGDDMDGKYYFGFGLGRNDLWVFDPVDISFEALPSCPCTPRSHPALVAHQGKVYMGAGSADSEDLKDWWVLDLETETWTQKVDIPGPNRHHPYQFGIDDAIYVGGGHIGNWMKWDINLETWSAIDDFPQGRVAGTQFSYDGKGYVLGGDNMQHDVLDDHQFLMYFPELDEWFELPFEEHMHRWAPSSFIINHEVFYFGGITYIGNDNGDMWKFDLNSVQCLAATGHIAIGIEETSVGLFFSGSPTGSTDTIQWREIGEVHWNSVANPTSLFQLDELTPCTDYEFRLNYGCDTGSSVYSDTKFFSTKGCGACIDNSYCDVENEFFALNCFINRIRINDYENLSGDNGGFEEFVSSDEANVNPGGLLEIEIEPGYSGSTQNGGLKVWLDLDFNGEYSLGELIIDDTSVSNLYAGSYQVPLDIQDGITRMRIVFDVNDIEGPCNGSFLSDGEVEDYCITIGNGITDIGLIEYETSIIAQPNPADQFISLFLAESIVDQVSIFNINGNLIREVAKDFDRIHIGDLDNGIYILKVRAENSVSSLKFVKQG